MQLKISQAVIKKYPFAKKSAIAWSDFLLLAAEASKLYTFPPCVTICQAALESGRGTSLLAKTKNNYFGFMAYDKDPTMAKKYLTALDSIIDYLELITKNPRYTKALRYKRPANILEAIWKAGYATDPQYVEKVISLKEWSIDWDQG